MADPVYLTINEFPGTGAPAPTIVDFAFAGGYISPAHVKAELFDPVTYLRTPVTVTDEHFVTDYRLSLPVSVPVGSVLRVYRDTPKDQPLVNFTNGARIAENNLDLVAQQAVFVAAESADQIEATQVADVLQAVEAAALSATAAQADAAASAAFAALSRAAAQDGASTAGGFALAAAASAASSSAAAASSAAEASAVRADLASTASGKGAELVAFQQAGAGAVRRSVQEMLRERVSIAQFGGSPSATPEQNAAALVAALAEHDHVDFPDGVYEFSFPVASGNNSLVTITDRSGIRITGRGATLKDVSAYSGDFLTDVIKFVRCHDVYVDVNYDATPLPDPTATYPNGIGYTGSSFLYFEEACRNIEVDSRIENARYGVRSGGYSDPTKGGCSGFDLRLRCYKTGYPAALYLADDVKVNINSDYQHRALFIAGCTNVRGDVTYTGFTYATVATLLTNSVTAISDVDADRRARGCSGVKLRITDNGSTGTVSARAMTGLAHQWKAPDTVFDDVHLHVYTKTTDANRTLAALRLENTVGWYTTNRFSNLKISGTLDRSAQTLAASSWANISIAGINAAEASPYSTSPKFSGISFEDFNVVNGAVTGNFDVINVPNLEDVMTFFNVSTNTTLSIIARSGEVSVEKSKVGNFVTGNIVARLNLTESQYGTIGSGISAYPLKWFDGNTFTPALAGSSSAGVGTYSAQIGSYTRIGNRVHFHLHIAWSAHTGTGNMKITGLPFTASDKTFCPVTIVPANITSPAGTSIYAMVPANEAAINLYSIAAATSAFAALAMDTAGSCWVSGSYEAA